MEQGAALSHAEFIEKHRFVIRLGKLLHRIGTPAYRLESHLLEVAKFLGIGGAFVVTPTLLTFVTWKPGEEEEYTHVARVLPGELDLGALSRADEVVDALSHGRMGLEEACQALQALEGMPNPYPRWATLLGFAFAGGAFAMLMQSSWANVGWSALLSILVYGFVRWAEASPRFGQMLEPVVATVSAFVATFLSRHVDPTLKVPMVVLSSIIVFIPGLVLTMGMAELAARHIVAGTSRVMDGIMLLFKLYFGAFLGMSLGNLIFGEPVLKASVPVPDWTSWLAVAALCGGLVVIFKARLRHAPWGLLAGFIAYGASQWGGQYLGLPLGAFVGAFAVGLYGNLFTRYMSAPGSIVSLQGMIVLVPGSKTYMGLYAFISGEHMVATQHLGQQTFLVFMSLVAGFLFAQVVLPPKKAL